MNRQHRSLRILIVAMHRRAIKTSIFIWDIPGATRGKIRVYTLQCQRINGIKLAATLRVT